MLNLPARAAALARRLFLQRAATATAGSLLAGAASALLGGRAVRAGTLEYTPTPYIGEIALLPHYVRSGVPAGWLLCDGSLVPISQYPALFSLLGTTYGGDGQTRFALPDLRGRVPLGAGAGPGLAGYSLGQRGGEATHVLTPAELPAHTHPVLLVSAPGTTSAPAGNFLASNAAGLPQYAATSGAQTGSYAANASTGHNNLQPYLAVQFIIATQGLYPLRE